MSGEKHCDKRNMMHQKEQKPEEQSHFIAITRFRESHHTEETKQLTQP